MAATDIRPGIYNVEYFSGSQVALYIGDVWVDEITSITYNVTQDRKPLYGYADQLFRDVSKGQVLIQGEFTVNFKEAGYLFLILNRFKQIMEGKESVLNLGSVPRLSGAIGNTPFASTSLAARETIESLVNNDGTFSRFERNRILAAMASEDPNKVFKTNQTRDEVAAGLGGYSEVTRARGGLGDAEDFFEKFEDMIWQQPQEVLENETRRADDPRINPFDIYLAFGDYTGNNAANHTIQKISGVHIVGSSKQIVIDGQPIQEAYSFIARNLV